MCGVFISYAIFFQAKNYEDQNRQVNFDIIAESYFVLISSAIEEEKNIIHAFAKTLKNEFVFEQADGLSQSEFYQMSNILDWTDHEILAAAWIPLIKLNEKDKFKGLPSIQKGSHDEDIINEVVDYHLPVLFSRIIESTDMIDGLDLAALPEYSEAFTRSMADNSIVTIHHAGEYDDKKPVFTILHPIFQPHKSPDVKSDYHIGFLAVDIDMAAVLEKALQPYPSQGLHIRMWDNHLPDALPELIYTHISRRAESAESAVFAERKQRLYDRDITFRFDASLSFLEDNASNLKWYLLTISLLMTCIVALMFEYLSKQKYAQQMSQKLSAAMEQSAQAIVITDKNGVIEYVNHAFTEITGYSVAELIGENPRMIGSGKQSKAFYEQMWETMLAGASWKGKITERRKDGSYYPAVLTISPIVSNRGEVTNFIGMHDDLSEQKMLEEKLQQSQKLEAVGTLVGGVAHNFNNLLGAITGKAYLGKIQMKNNPEKSLNHLESITGLSYQAAEMINQLLVFSRKSTVEMKNIPFQTLMKETAKIAQVGVPENIQVVMSFTSEPLIVYGNSVELQQMLMNLINNARDAMVNMEHGRLNLTLESCAENVCLNREHCSACVSSVAKLIVEDTGEGISEENLEHIFEPFFTTKDVNKGTGLGLSTLHGTVTKHGGVVRVVSELGQGTKFTICIPTVNDVVETVLDKKELKTIHAKAAFSILVIDDDEMIRTTLVNILSSIGYNVFAAVDGLEGVEMFNQHRDDVSLVITDIVMPNMNGYEAIDAIREHTPELPVIYITGYDKISTVDKVELNEKTKFINILRVLHLELETAKH